MALFAEGPKDHRLLPSILKRLAEDVCINHANRIVEVGAVVPLHSPGEMRDADRKDRILEAARRADSVFHVLFIHTDAGNDPDGARAERVTPAVDAIAERLVHDDRRTVAVVPIRETEAWAVADGDALRAAFGTTMTNAQLGIPDRPADVESILDPKQCLQAALDAVVGPGRRRKKLAADFLEAIGERVRLSELFQVPAFAATRDELRDALTGQGFLQ